MGVEVETRISDVQAVVRRVALKLRDDREVSGAILLLSNTRHHRTLLREREQVLRTEFPVEQQAMLLALSQGRDPGGSGIVLL
jgi:hypothetical protein